MRRPAVRPGPAAPAPGRAVLPAVLLAVLLAVVAAGGAGAQVDCGGFRLSDSRDAAAFCDELNALLAAPHEGGLSERSSPGEDADLARILRDNPLLHEAFRSQPERTLDLIRRIRAAGGLSP